ncbi:hypothetical protein DFH94DRAFT_346427 [Russula ochroleuca]|uniref:Uncharacterized protein n=1 Tax=Russula ochroleuca TaxID=152965 RepID=A0A9P5JVS1_9AGAM|nr:hypothetical protein DFH94DRAFT_346395 [Russula ochroleuca]KAF8466047.1 hypothetical protein DFH94DRAFT_346427 [Russula ochroleuca]
MLQQLSGSEVQIGLKYLRFMGHPAPSSLLVLTSPSTLTVPATRKIYNASLQAERYPQVTPQFPRLSIRTSIGFPRLTDPVQAEACSRGRQQADFRTQGHGCSVQGDEVAASSDIQHEAGDHDTGRPFPFSSAQAKQDHQGIREASDRPGEVSDHEDSYPCYQSKATSGAFQLEHELAIPHQATRSRLQVGEGNSPSTQTLRSPCRCEGAPFCPISHPLFTPEGCRRAIHFPFYSHVYRN